MAMPEIAQSTALRCSENTVLGQEHIQPGHIGTFHGQQLVALDIDRHRSCLAVKSDIHIDGHQCRYLHRNVMEEPGARATALYHRYTIIIIVWIFLAKVRTVGHQGWSKEV